MDCVSINVVSYMFPVPFCICVSVHVGSVCDKLIVKYCFSPFPLLFSVCGGGEGGG